MNAKQIVLLALAMFWLMIGILFCNGCSNPVSHPPVKRHKSKTCATATIIDTTLIDSLIIHPACNSCHAYNPVFHRIPDNSIE